MFQLMCRGVLSMGDFDRVSLDDVDMALRALHAWDAAQVK